MGRGAETGTGPAAGAAVDAWLVAGLGNPGRAYAGHRHNVGFMVVDLLARRAGARFRRHRRAVAEVAEGRLVLGGSRLVLAKPLSFMNRSGAPVAGLCRFFSLEPAQVIAVHDDLDLPYGAVRTKRGGGDGGHNGLRSLTASLSTKDYLRVRFGVGRPTGRRDPADYVLSDFSAVERKELDYFVDRAADCVETLVTDGLEAAQRTYHAS